MWSVFNVIRKDLNKLTNKKSTNFAMQSQLNNSLLLTQILHQRKAAAIYISSFLIWSHQRESNSHSQDENLMS